MRNLSILTNEQLKELNSVMLINFKCAFDLKDEIYLKAEIERIKFERMKRKGATL